MTSVATIYFDGACKSNPGPMSIGVVIQYNGSVKKISKNIGNGTNNIAEYSALIYGLKYAGTLDIKKIIVKGDSMLVINQVFGKWKVNSKRLFELYTEVQKIIEDLKKKGVEITGEWIEREKNTEADDLSKKAIDLIH